MSRLRAVHLRPTNPLVIIGGSDPEDPNCALAALFACTICRIDGAFSSVTVIGPTVDDDRAPPESFSSNSTGNNTSVLTKESSVAAEPQCAIGHHAKLNKWAQSAMQVDLPILAARLEQCSTSCKSSSIAACVLETIVDYCAEAHSSFRYVALDHSNLTASPSPSRTPTPPPLRRVKQKRLVTDFLEVDLHKRRVMIGDLNINYSSCVSFAPCLSAALRNGDVTRVVDCGKLVATKSLADVFLPAWHNVARDLRLPAQKAEDPTRKASAPSSMSAATAEQTVISALQAFLEEPSWQVIAQAEKFRWWSWVAVGAAATILVVAVLRRRSRKA